MAMIKCKECGAEVSNKAKTCPSCGAPTPKKTSIFTWIVGAFLVAFFYGMISSETTPAPQKTPEEIAKEKADQDRNAKVLIGAKSIKQSLRDPSSLQFEQVTFINENNATCYHYLARNGFGGMNQEGAVLVSNGDMIFDKAGKYNHYCKDKQGVDLSAFVRAAPL